MNYKNLNILIWSASLMLWIASFYMGEYVVLKHSIIPPPEPSGLQYLEITPSKPITVQKIPSKHVISKSNKELHSYISSFNVTNARTVSQIVKAISDSSKQFSIPKTVLIGLIATESSFDPEAKSKKKCLGLTQVNPEVWLEELKDEGIVKNKKDLKHPVKNIKAGAYILRQYLDEAESKGKKHPMRYALAKFNGSKSGKYYKQVMDKVKG